MGNTIFGRAGGYFLDPCSLRRQCSAILVFYGCSLSQAFWRNSL